MQVTLDRRIMDLERETPLKYKVDEQSIIIEEYEVIVENLKQELQDCKTEQAILRSGLETLQNENKTIANNVREQFSQTQIDDSGGGSYERDMMSNLQKRIAIMQMEKESVFQLWQMALKAIDILEGESKAFHREGKGTKFYEEQLNSVRETYSDAIKALEMKLIQAKENFLKHQSLWESNRDKMNALSREKDEVTQKLTAIQKIAVESDSRASEAIESLKTELTVTKLELQKATKSQSELEAKLREAQKFVAMIVAKDNETKNKVSEAIELVESAVQEKELALQREARALEDKLKLESQLANIVEEYNASLENDVSKVKETYERNVKKYLLDMKELKLDLQQKATLLDRAQRECRLVEEELDKVRHGSDDFLHQSNSKMLSLEQRLKEAEFKLQVCEDSCRKKNHVQLQQLEQQVAELQEKLAASCDQLKRVQKQTSRELEERVREADERTKEVVERYATLERRLARAIDERESVSAELRSLQNTFEWEGKRKDQERRVLENRVRDLKQDLEKAASCMEQTAAHGDILAGQINVLELELKKKCGITKITNDGEYRSKGELMEQMVALQESCDKKTKELTQHVEIHQKLSRKWKQEAKTISSSFQKRLKELRGKVSALRKENEELNRELLSCRHQLAQCREKIIHRYDQGDAMR